jgi:hypothetical protein
MDRQGNFNTVNAVEKSMVDNILPIHNCLYCCHIGQIKEDKISHYGWFL